MGPRVPSLSPRALCVCTAAYANSMAWYGGCGNLNTSFRSARIAGVHLLHSASVVPNAPGPRMTVRIFDTVAAVPLSSWEKPCASGH